LIGDPKDLFTRAICRRKNAIHDVIWRQKICQIVPLYLATKFADLATKFANLATKFANLATKFPNLATEFANLATQKIAKTCPYILATKYTDLATKIWQPNLPKICHYIWQQKLLI